VSACGPEPGILEQAQLAGYRTNPVYIRNSRYVPPWTVIRTEEQDEYMSALEAASVDQEIEPFAAFVERAVGRAVGEFT